MQTATDRIALITGANKGIGLEIARQICKAACKLLVGARNAALGGAAAETLRAEGIDSRAITLDVTMPVTIQAAAAIIKAEYGRLDILVNTAGITGGATDGPPSKADINTVRRVLETNFFGVLAVTQAMVPLLRNAASARVVNVSSGLGSLTHNGDPEWEFAGAKFIG